MANVVELMREYKRLKALKKKGNISPEQTQQLREVANFLKSEMENRKSGSGNSAPEPVPAKPAPAKTPVSTPVVVPAPPSPATTQEAKPTKPTKPTKSTKSTKPLWKQQAEEQAERQKRAQAHFQVAMPDEIDDYTPAVTAAEDVDDDDDSQDEEPIAKKRPRPRNDREMQEQFDEIYASSLYVRSFDDLQSELYFSYEAEGYEPVGVEDEDELELQTIDPREMELQRAGLLSDDSDSAEALIDCVPGGVFLDDFMLLYEQGILPQPDEDAEPEVDDPNALIPGKRKVTLHMLNGQVKRGHIGVIMRTDLGFKLNLGRGKSEDIDFSQIKALFVMMGKTEPPDLTNAQKISVEFKDHRRVAGLSPDYQPGAYVFTLVPSGRGNFERVIIYSGAVAKFA